MCGHFKKPALAHRNLWFQGYYFPGNIEAGINVKSELFFKWHINNNTGNVLKQREL